MLKTIKLHGILAQKFGDYFELAVDSVLEATHAIACQNPEFKAFMMASEQNGLRFAVFADDDNLGEHELGRTTTAQTIHIVPKIMGAGGKALGIAQVVVGAVLVGAGVFMGFNPQLIGSGIGLMLGGAASLLMPTPQLDTADPDGNRANYGFGGAITTVAQGNPVPVLYGERDVGGFMCSAGIFTEDNQ